MRIYFDKGKGTLSADATGILASSSELLELDLRDMGALLRLTGSDAAKVTMKPKANLAPGAEVFVTSFSASDLVASADVYRQYANYNTVAMAALLAATNPSNLVMDVQYIPASGPRITSPTLALSASLPVSNDDDGTPQAVPNADTKYLRFDQAQALTGMADASAISDADGLFVRQSGQTKLGLWSAVKTWIKSWIAKADVGLSAVTNDAQLKASDLDTDGTLAANSDTKIPSQKAVKTFVAAGISALVNGAGAALDTLNELAAALGNDPNFATTVATNLAAKEATANKSTDVSADGSSNTKYPSVKAVKDYVDGHSGGTTLQRVANGVSGWTSPGVAAHGAVSTVNLSTSFVGFSDPQEFTFTTQTGSMSFSFGSFDPGDGSIYCGPDLGNPETNVDALVSAVNGSGGAIGLSAQKDLNPDDNSWLGTVTFNETSGATGLSSTLNTPWSSETGADAVAPSGQVNQANIIAAAAGKKNKIVSFLILSNGCGGWHGNLTIGYPSGVVLSVPVNGPADGLFTLPAGGTFNENYFRNVPAANEALYVAFAETDGDTQNNFGGGSMTVSAVIDQS